MSPEEVTEGGCDPVNSGNARTYEEPDISEEIFNEESTRQWRLQLEKEMEKLIEVPRPLKENNARLTEIWANNKGIREAIIIKLNEFIYKSLYGAIEKVNDKMMKVIKWISPKIRGKKKLNYYNRNKTKRYSYAHCQELFKECPKKLADFVVNNDRAYLEPARQPPEAIELKRLYEDLWGRAGPSNPQIPGNRSSELIISNCFRR